MKGLGTVGTCFLITVAAGAIASVLQFAVIGLFLVALITQPRATLTFVGGFVLLGLIDRYPWAFIAIITFGLAVRWMESRHLKDRPLPRLYRPRAKDRGI